LARPLPRGAVVRLDATIIAVGSEAGATHPVLAVVVQADAFRLGKTVVVVPFTTRLDRARKPFGVLVPRTAGNGLAEDSVAMCWLLWSIDKGRLERRPLGRVSDATLDLISKNVAALIDYEPDYLSRTTPPAPGSPPASRP